MTTPAPFPGPLPVTKLSRRAEVSSLDLDEHGLTALTAAASRIRDELAAHVLTLVNENVDLVSEDRPEADAVSISGTLVVSSPTAYREALAAARASGKAADRSAAYEDGLLAALACFKPVYLDHGTAAEADAAAGARCACRTCRAYRNAETLITPKETRP